MKLILIGDGDDRLALEKFAHDENVVFEGQQSHERAMVEMTRSKVTVTPSACWETFGLSSAESMSNGTPVVVSDIGALPDLVGDGECGEVFESGNAEALAAAIRRLLNRPDYDEMCERCKKRVAERYSEEANYRRLMEIYDGVLA